MPLLHVAPHRQPTKQMHFFRNQGRSYAVRKRAKEGGRVFRSTFLVNERVLEPLSWTKQDIRAIFLQRQEGGEWYPAFLTPHPHTLEWHFRHRVGGVGKTRDMRSGTTRSIAPLRQSSANSDIATLIDAIRVACYFAIFRLHKHSFRIHLQTDWAKQQYYQSS